MSYYYLLEYTLVLKSRANRKNWIHFGNSHAKIGKLKYKYYVNGIYDYRNNTNVIHFFDKNLNRLSKYLRY